MKFLTLQQASVPDNVAEDGEVMYQKPYPLHVNEDGFIGQQGFWRGHIHFVVGFTDRPEPGSIPLLWPQAWADPDRCIGKYLVTANAQGNWSVWPTGVETAEFTDLDPSFMEA